MQDPLDTSDKGYQPPIDESMVKEFDPEDTVVLRRVGLFAIVCEQISNSFLPVLVRTWFGAEGVEPARAKARTDNPR